MSLIILSIIFTFLMLFYNGYQDGSYLLLPLYSNDIFFKNFAKNKSYLFLPIIGEIFGAIFLGKIVLNKILFGFIDISSIPIPNLSLLFLVILSINLLIYFISSFLPFPVSLSHSVIGGLIGLAIALRLKIQWYSLLLTITIWTLTPLASMILSFLIYNLIQIFFYRYNNSMKIKKLLLFILLFLIYSLTIFLVLKFSRIALFVLSVFFFIFLIIFFKLIFKRGLKEKIENFNYQKTEELFALLDLFILPNVFLSHGANDVANSISLIYFLFLSFFNKSETYLYLLLFVGAIVLSSAIILKGSKKSEKLSQSIFKIDCSKSFSSYFSLFISIILFSIFGFRVSSVYTLTGSYIGIGYAKGFSIFNSKLIFELLISWIITFGISIFLSYLTINSIIFLNLI